MLLVGAKHDGWEIGRLLHESGESHLVGYELCMSVRFIKALPSLFDKQILNSRNTKTEEKRENNEKRDDTSKSDINGEDYIQDRVNEVLFSSPGHKKDTKEDEKNDKINDVSKIDINGEDYIQDRVNQVLFSSPGRIR